MKKAANVKTYTNKQAEFMLETVMAMGSSLAQLGHKWTAKEKHAFNRVTCLLIKGKPERKKRRGVGRRRSIIAGYAG